MNLPFTIIIPVLIFLTGLLFKIWLDRRKEYNTFIEPIRNRLIQALKQPGIDIGFNDHNILDIRSHLVIWQRKSFDKAIVEYYKSISEENSKKDGQGGFTYIDSKKIIHASENLLKYIKKQ